MLVGFCSFKRVTRTRWIRGMQRPPARVPVINGAKPDYPQGVLPLTLIPSGVIQL